MAEISIDEIKANNPSSLLGRVTSVQAGGRHAIISVSDGESRGALIHPSMVNHLPETAGEGNSLLEVGSQVLVLLRDCDALRADIIYIFPRSLEDSTKCSSEKQSGDETVIDDGESPLDDDEDERDFKAQADIDLTFEPVINKHHHHFLFKTIPEETVDENDGVYCDICQELIGEREANLTCLVPYCFFDLCLACSTNDNATVSKKPLFDIVSASEDSIDDKKASDKEAAGASTGNEGDEDGEDIWEDEDDDLDDGDDDDDDYYGSRFESDSADIYGPKFFINSTINYNGSQWRVTKIVNRSNFDNSSSAIPNSIPDPIGWTYWLSSIDGAGRIEKLAEEELV